MSTPKKLVDSKAWRPLSFLLEVQEKNTKNSIKSLNYLKSKKLRELKNSALIDWYIAIKPSVLCSGWKSTSEKMSVDSIQN